MGSLSRASDVRTLASSSYLPDPSGYMSVGINKVLAHIGGHLTEPFNESDLAGIAGQSPSAFSRSFRKHTGMALVQYVNRLRINLACQLLMSDDAMPITEICYAVGLQQPVQFQSPVPGAKGHAALAASGHCWCKTQERLKPPEPEGGGRSQNIAERRTRARWWRPAIEKARPEFDALGESGSTGAATPLPGPLANLLAQHTSCNPHPWENIA